MVFKTFHAVTTQAVIKYHSSYNDFFLLSNISVLKKTVKSPQAGLNNRRRSHQITIYNNKIHTQSRTNTSLSSGLIKQTQKRLIIMTPQHDDQITNMCVHICLFVATLTIRKDSASPWGSRSDRVENFHDQIQIRIRLQFRIWPWQLRFAFQKGPFNHPWKNYIYFYDIKIQSVNLIYWFCIAKCVQTEAVLIRWYVLIIWIRIRSKIDRIRQHSSWSPI